jgi:monofunctional biosynthetic peptidoglycan transglycosylase
LLGIILLTVLQVALARFINPPCTPLMLYRWLQGEGLRVQWRSLGSISPYLQQAVITSEDQLFLSHNGFDYAQINRAIREHLYKGRQRGASTITMQTARNLFLWQGHSWLRKILEAYYTFLIELLWNKARIMEVYLNIAEWGKGTFGAEAAAQYYFTRPASGLTTTQAALMAAVLPNPRRWSPAHPTGYILKRTNFILRHMHHFRPIKKLRR